MTKNYKKKKAIFDIYVNNLALLNEIVTINNFKKNSYACPICLRYFSDDALLHSSSIMLTLEDTPPKSMGGKPVLLTCKICNSNAGHDLDADLLSLIKESSLKGRLPNTTAQIKFTNGTKSMQGEMSIDNKGETVLNLDTDRSNPAHSKSIINKIFLKNKKLIGYDELHNYDPKDNKFQIKLKQKWREPNAKIALLRIAYLLAFKDLGYAFLLNDNLSQIREQIVNPNKEILKGSFIFFIDSPEAQNGISIISEPSKIQSILVVFKLQRGNFNKNFGILLPGPTNEGLTVYEHLSNGIDDDVNEVKLERIPNVNYLTEKRFVVGILDLWRKIPEQKST